MRLQVLSVLIWGALAGLAMAQEQPALLSVSGQGQVAVAPDMAVMSLGVVHTGKTADGAMDKVSADVTAMITVLGDAGIAARDIQTSQLSINPIWDQRSDRARRITGFEARNTVAVRVRDLDNLGSVLDQVLNVGANTFQGLHFQLQDPKAAEAEARAAAVRDAMEKAGQMSGAAGLTLGRVLRIDEGGAAPRPEMFAAAARSADVPIAAGELSVRVQVSMTFALEP